MSTTITYNNTTSAPFSKTTKYLNTAGKWVEHDIRVTDTGMSEDDSLYQDMNGFITLSDDYSTATRTEPLTITENGTYTAPANTGYSPVEVVVPSSEFIKSVIDKSVTQATDEDLAGATKIGAYSFYNCTNLESVELPNSTTTVEEYAFFGCSSLTDINSTIENITTINGNYAFGNCTSLENVLFPKLTSMSAYIFNRSGNNIIGVFPKLTSISQSFRMSNFSIIDLGPSLNGLGTYFANTSTIQIIILRKADAITTIGSTNGFDGTPFASNGTGGTLYVPQALVETYQSATNWSTILGYENNQILPIEGSQYEHYYADGTSIE